MVKTRGRRPRHRISKAIVTATSNSENTSNTNVEDSTTIENQVEAAALNCTPSLKTQDLGSDIEARVPQPDDAALPQMAVFSSDSNLQERPDHDDKQSIMLSVVDEDSCKECKPKPHLPAMRYSKKDSKAKRSATSISSDGPLLKSGVEQTHTLCVGITELPQVARKTKDVQPRLMTDYFPVRRSGRKTYKSLSKEKHKAVEEAILSGNEDGFQVKEFLGKGRGIITNKTIRQGEFVLEYCGELIDVQEAKGRELAYAADRNIGCYMYYFRYKNKQYCVDATHETNRLGRLVNHSKKGNLHTKPFLVGSVPHLILVAQRDIDPGEELLYDYGDRSKESLQSHPWLKT